MSIYIAQSPYRSAFSGASKRRRPFVPSAKSSVLTRGQDRKGDAVAGALQLFQQVKSKKVHFEFGSTSVIVGFIALALLMSILHLIHFNKVATKGYELKRLDANHQQLLSQYEIKNMQLAEYQSLNNIVVSDRVAMMRRPVSVTFVSGNTALASR